MPHGVMEILVVDHAVAVCVEHFEDVLELLVG